LSKLTQTVRKFVLDIQPRPYDTPRRGTAGTRELDARVRIPITGIGATQKKMEKDPDEIVRLLRALRLATLYLLQYSEYRRDVFQRIMRVNAPTVPPLRS
jgi:ABC-type nitrate/sulfonate/bicarbonate transport system substrate-binding protein